MFQHPGELPVIEKVKQHCRKDAKIYGKKKMMQWMEFRYEIWHCNFQQKELHVHKNKSGIFFKVLSKKGIVGRNARSAIWRFQKKMGLLVGYEWRMLEWSTRRSKIWIGRATNSLIKIWGKNWNYIRLVFEIRSYCDECWNLMW